VDFFMPRYFFDVHTDKGVERDDTGSAFADMKAVRKEAQRLLPDLAREEIPEDGDHRSFTALVTGEDGHPVYSATLNYAGLWLLR
jgi:uncharacterized protein DUF6894